LRPGAPRGYTSSAPSSRAIRGPMSHLLAPRTALAASLTGLALAACGDDVALETQPGADAAANADALPADGTIEEAAPRGTDAVDSAVEIGEIAPLDTAGQDVTWVETPCEKNEDCSSGACLPTPNGPQCAQPCVDKCPPDFECKQSAVSTDVQFVCVHKVPYRCAPCKSDADCAVVKGQGGVCADLGQGAFCVQGCDAGAACVGAGFACAKAKGGQSVCQPPGGACPCPDGKSGACDVVNAFGTCKGSYTCLANKPGVCVGKQAAIESCNSQDDDCDGATDEEVPAAACDLANVYGTCKGKAQCVAGTSLCQGTQAAAEVCNGIDDNCSGTTDEGSADGDGDGQADCIDKDDDGDGVDDAADNCPVTLNAGQTDTDGDKQGDACDGDDDNDKVDDGADNCPLAANPTQADTDSDGKGDVCDCDLDGDGAANGGYGCPADVTADNCPAIANESQQDADADGQGDACDADQDGDGVANAVDNCPSVSNADQANFDKGAYGDACDDDDDDDGVPDPADNCPLAANPTQVDLDGDAKGDECDDDLDGDNVANAKDNCPGIANPDQTDANANKIGDACENDLDSDGVVNAADNCPWSANPGQLDTDKDGKGDACDCDLDDDGVPNAAYGCSSPKTPDNCPAIANPSQADLDKDGSGDACDNDQDGDGDPNGSDCAPLDKAVSKLAKEACNGKDDDCDAQTDEEDASACKPFYFDGDGDGAGVTLVKCLCAASGQYTATAAGDCNDQSAAIHPKATELCNNGQDDNCNGSENDENASECKIFHVDKDGDGYGGTATKCLCTPQGDFTAKQGGDCNDGDAAMSPGQTEQCKDGKDNDCDKQIDETGCSGCTTFYKDGDGDGFGQDGDKKCLSGAGSGYTALKAGDCNDADKAVSPVGTESCNGKDDDCDAQTDETDALGCKKFYPDEDKDGFGTAAGQCLCKAGGLYTSVTPTDCNDKDITVSPAKAEICGNGKDDNCAGGESEENAINCSKFYFDADKDGYGVGAAKCFCSAIGSYAAPLAGDCSDTDAARSPGLAEKCQDKKDNDCDSQIDEENCLGCINFFKDGDADGYGIATDKKCLSAASLPYAATLAGDCADADKTVKPGAVEACNGKDDNCAGGTDEAGAKGCTALFTDADQDGWGVGASQCLCAATGSVTAVKDGDCDDKDVTVNPDRSEVCGNGKDDNCKAGETDIGAGGCVTFYSDGDGDGYGVGAGSCLCTPQGEFSAKLGGDCKDDEAAINPGQPEKCLDGKDNNCSGATDEAGCQGCQNYHKDADADGFGQDGDKQCLGAAKYPYTAFLSGDCNDDPAKGGSNVKPGAPEMCNGVDDNCDGQTDPTGTSGCQNFYPDADKDGYGAQVSALCLCKATAAYAVTKTGDCNDANLAIHPTATEVCDGADNNCNSQVDEGVLKTFYKDEDGDGYGGPTSQLGCKPPAGYAALAGDCNDFNKAIFPKAKEVCNDVDDDCNSLVDDGMPLQTIYKDNDGDKFAPQGAAVQVKCNVPVLWTTAQDPDGDGKPNWDCVDSDSTIYPFAPDTCGDDKDNDCDGAIDKLCYSECAGSWPFKLQYTSGNAAARPFDYDGDGLYEVMVADEFGFAVLATSGAPMYNTSAPNYNYSRTTPALADVDTYDVYGSAIQNLEIVTGNGSKAKLLKINPDGTVVAIDSPQGVFNANKFLVSDLNFDGQPELIYQTWCEKNSALKLFRYDKVKKSLDLVSNVADPDGACQYYARVLTDLNGDGVSELVLGNGYPGTGGAISPATWGGHLFAYKLTDPAKALFGDWCAPNGSCAFNTAITGLNGVYVSGLIAQRGKLLASVVYSPTKLAGEQNQTETRYWAFGLDGKGLPGSPTTVVPVFQPTDVDDDGVVEGVGSVQDLGLFDVNGDGFPDQIASSGSELRLNLWSPVKKTFVEYVPSRKAISALPIGVRGAWDMNGDGTLEVTAADSAGKVYCYTLGANTWNKKAVLPPHVQPYLRTSQWDNYEPNEGKDTNGDGVPDQVIRLASALTAKGQFASYLSTATDVDFYQIDTAWGGNICLQSPKGRAYTLSVYATYDKIHNTTKAAPGDGKPDGLIWTGSTAAGGAVCFNGNSVPPPFRYGEYRFVVGIQSKTGFSPYWPYWLTAAK